MDSMHAKAEQVPTVYPHTVTQETHCYPLLILIPSLTQMRDAWRRLADERDAALAASRVAWPSPLTPRVLSALSQPSRLRH
jgi:hypothetical protein